MPAAVQLVIFAAIVLVFWAVIMRPARNQQRAMRDVQRSVEVGDDVIISAGIFGTVRSVDDAKVELEIAPGTVVTVARQVVVRRADESPDVVTEPGTDMTKNPVETDEKSE
ncbi:MAG TPA: preprotein translocase subunit YajC [Marmoricola sp.]